MHASFDLDQDVVQAAQRAAARRKVTVDQILSEWIRRGMEPEPWWTEERNGVPLLPRSPSGEKITEEHIRKLRDQE